MDEPRVVLAQLPACVVHQPAKVKELRAQWDEHCAKILAGARLTPDQRIKVVMDWLHKAGVRDFVLGKLLLSFARPLPVAPTEDQKKERRQKALVRMAYQDDLPHLRAVNKVVTNRLEGVPGDSLESLAQIYSREDREKETPGTMFAEFAQSIDEQLAIEYARIPGSSDSPFVDAAE